MVGVVIVPAVLLLLVLGLTIWAIVKLRGTTRIVLGIIGGLSSVLLGFATLVAMVVYSFSSSVTTFDPNKHHGPMGTLQLPYTCDVSLCVHRTGESKGAKMQWVHGNNGRIKLPVGKYLVLGYSIGSVKGKSFGGSFRDSNPSAIIKANKVSELRVGEPIVVALRVEQTKDNQLSVAPDVRGCAGEDCRLDGLRGFRVFDQSGRELMEGKFEFG